MKNEKVILQSTFVATTFRFVDQAAPAKDQKPGQKVEQPKK